MTLDKAIEAVWSRCFAYALRLTRDRDDADDLMQTVAIKVWTKYQGEPTESAVRAYFAKSLYHQFLDDLAKYRPQRFICEPEVEFIDPMERQIADKAVLDSLRALTPRQRRALWLKAFGSDGIEAAETMGMSHDGYRQLLRRSRLSMQIELSKRPPLTAALFLFSCYSS